MGRWLNVLLMLAFAAPAWADAVIATRTIPARTILARGDLALQSGKAPVAGQLAAFLGQEARVTLYAGRPVRATDLGPPAVVGRNQIVPLVFSAGGLRITAAGRALDRAGAGEVIRVMNLSSRATLFGLVLADGRIRVPN